MENIFNNKQILEITGTILSKEKKAEALCNEVYFLDAQNGKFIIKISTGTERQNELEKELNIINNLKDKFLMPKIYLYLKEDNISLILMEFIEGEKPTIFTDNILESMAKTLKKIHSENDENCIVNFDKLIEVAEKNMENGKLDLDEFNVAGKFVEPKEVLEFLKQNKPQAKQCLLHGDFRPKNMIIHNSNLYVLDWGLSFYGDFYYDLAIIKWYFTKEQFEKFLEFYGLDKIDEKRLKYNEWLSAFLNV